MEVHYQLSDDEFESQFANCKLDPSVFSHEAHLRLAWIHLRKYGIDTAVENIVTQLQQFVSHAGAADKYHHTLTIAAVHAVNHFIVRSHIDNFSDFIAESPQLRDKFRELINSHYSIDIFRNEDARRHYIAPDLQPFE